MRSKRPGAGKAVAAVMIMALLWLAFGTFGMLKLKDRILEDAGAEQEVTDQYEQAPDPEEDEEDAAEEDDLSQDEEEEPPEEDEDEEDEDDDEEEPEKDYVVMVVRAPDNYAAVRTGRGTQYQEVGRITNGHRVALKDLENGWYQIAKGKYKGYYTHQSSYVPE